MGILSENNKFYRVKIEVKSIFEDKISFMGYDYRIGSFGNVECIDSLEQSIFDRIYLLCIKSSIQKCTENDKI